jgi:FAD/FMN-containing dehydrogenase
MGVDLAYAAYEQRRARLQANYASLPSDAPVRLAKRTSNLFRTRVRQDTPGLRGDDFAGVLSVDPERRTADVQGMTTYEDLVAATLPYGLMPRVVPQLRTITLGGAVTGLGIESSSFRNGLPHESVLELEVLTGDGRVVIARPDNEHRALYYGFPNSYGTLGYALRLTIELEPVQPYVEVQHRRFTTATDLFAAMDEVCAQRSGNDFVDATLFSRGELYLTTGRFVPAAKQVSDYSGMDVYYRSIQRRSTDYLTTHDYLWRWDTDWFWCSRAFAAQKPWVRRLWPKDRLRSHTYWRIVALDRRYQLSARYDRLRGRPRREAVVQDIEVPIDRAPEFHDFFVREIGIAPVWACPLRQRNSDVTWELYSLDPSKLYVNFGFWSSVPLRPGETDGTYNRRIEAKVEEMDGRKSLYSTAFYDEDHFWELYGGATYELLKKTYDPDNRLLDLYDKCVRRR